MRVVALISGGKDSCYNMMQCVEQGHVIVALANLKPKDGDELDSYMYQTVGHHAVDLYAEAMSLPLYRRIIQGSSVEQGRVYTAHKQDEVEDLYELLKEIKVDISFDAVSVGAIQSDYQRVRVEHVCSRLGLSALAYLWRRDQKILLDEMISSGVDAILIKVAAMGLSPSKHLGMSISEVFPLMCSLNIKYGSNICGEGGEYETFTLDCPLFKKKIVIDESEVIIHSDDAFAPVGFLHFKKMHLQDKEPVHPDGVTTVEHRKADKCVQRRVLIPSTRLQENKEGDIEHHRCGDYIWISGICGHCVVDGKTLSIEEVAKNIMQIMSDTLTDLKACLEDAVMVHVFVNNMDDFTKVNSVYKTFFTVNPPARACVQLDLPEDIVIQVECLVYSPQTANHQIEAPVREAMHVQSISHWAPANIGPYSQAIKVGDTMFVSGSIGLWPPTMTLIAGGVLEEASLSLQHVDRIISAFVSGESLKSIVHGFCFVTSSAAVSVAKNALYEASGIKQPDDGEQDLPHLPVMLFVVVPALPKGASVEWHVVAQDSQIQHQYDSHSLCREGFNIDVQSVAIKGRSNFSVAINCVVESNSAIICNLEEILACFVSELQDCASQHSISLSNLMYTRIFYVKDIMDHLNARNFIQEYLERTTVIAPVFSLVCVNALEREQSILTFSCLLQRPEIDEEE